jgi:hypothetical protein
LHPIARCLRAVVVAHLDGRGCGDQQQIGPRPMTSLSEAAKRAGLI